MGGVNTGSAGLFFYDKKCAEARQWRVPEATLCLTALAGGWMGGMYVAFSLFVLNPSCCGTRMPLKVVLSQDSC